MLPNATQRALQISGRCLASEAQLKSAKHADLFGAGHGRPWHAKARPLPGMQPLARDSPFAHVVPTFARPCESGPTCRPDLSSRSPENRDWFSVKTFQNGYVGQSARLRLAIAVAAKLLRKPTSTRCEGECSGRATCERPWFFWLLPTNPGGQRRARGWCRRPARWPCQGSCRQSGNGDSP